MINFYLFQKLTLNFLFPVDEVPNVSWEDIGVWKTLTGSYRRYFGFIYWFCC
jgi:hypothetical protein